jgi:hypothetical protein
MGKIAEFCVTAPESEVVSSVVSGREEGPASGKPTPAFDDPLIQYSPVVSG